MKVLIFGGAGYVGYELAKRFIENGDSVVVYDSLCNGDPDARTKITALKGVILYEQSISDVNAVKDAIHTAQPDLVYNLAAVHYIPYCIENPEVVFSTNYQGLQNIITALKNFPTTKFIFASSASVYGSPNAQCTLDTPTNPNDIYGASKLAGEYLIKYQLANAGLRRLFNVSGELDPHPHLIPKVARAAVRNEVLNLGTATAERDFIYVKDVANAFFIARLGEPGRTYIIASGTTHSVKEVVDKIYELSGSTGEVHYETAGNIRSNDASYLSGDSSGLRELGWQPTVTIEQGLLTAIDAARRASHSDT